MKRGVERNPAFSKNQRFNEPAGATLKSCPGFIFVAASINTFNI
jgi:hypothetical protein